MSPDRFSRDQELIMMTPWISDSSRAKGKEKGNPPMPRDPDQRARRARVLGSEIGVRHRKQERATSAEELDTSPRIATPRPLLIPRTPERDQDGRTRTRRTAPQAPRERGKEKEESMSFRRVRRRFIKCGTSQSKARIHKSGVCVHCLELERCARKVIFSSTRELSLIVPRKHSEHTCR